MKRLMALLLVLIMFSSLMVSGCTDQSDSEVENETASEDAAQDLLAQEGAALTDEEISSLDADLAELESMLEGFDNESNITVEEL
ncbi:hypothetical protein [Methanohalophilus halophilus]|uniref:Uncharacterized protein n=1 Tax=Methanohalophilus halophilus TaxID=2177 RepID=A0A1L3PZR5_9EURY|nr:hypothetical protein [Methanohalophilus halophilus]APH38116.1 hypothetical protein BHR79_00545 [Methanohalophilus halophilus]RNI11019.1 hypothetical protein EFE40_02255 [Methanohalophilus halophilus]SDW82353.1 hypothetical protein SAMN04515625_1668 [Methanohalophilus halophilus]